MGVARLAFLFVPVHLILDILAVMFDLGFVSAIMAESNFTSVVDFASDQGFRCIEMMCWPLGKAERRYAGVTHIDVDNLDDERVAAIQHYLSEKGVYISGLG